MFYYRVNAAIELRLLEERHADLLVSLIQANQAYLKRWQPGYVDVTTVEEVTRGIKASLQRFADNNGFQAGIWVAGALVGTVTCNSIDWSNQNADIGYWLGERFQGQGVATQACKALIDYLIHDLKLQRIEIVTIAGNRASRKIPERLGFHEEGIARQKYWLHDTFVDSVTYGLLAHEWPPAIASTPNGPCASLGPV